MLLLKGKSIAGPTKSVTISKFKVYSEKSNVYGRDRDNIDTSSSRKSTQSMKGSLLSNSAILKGKDLVIGAQETKVSRGLLGKTKLARKALADVCNIRVNSSRGERPGVSRKSMSCATVTSTSSSVRPPVDKAKASKIGVATVVHPSLKGTNKSMRTFSNFRRAEANETVQNMIRNSFPAVKKPKQLGSSHLQSKDDNRSAEKSKSARKAGFPVKTRIGGLSHLKTKVTKDRASDGFTRVSQRNQTSRDALPGLRKSVKAISRTTLRISYGPMNTKSKSILSLDKSLGTRVKVTRSSAPETFKPIVAQEEVIKGVNSSKGSDSMKSQMLSMPSKKYARRKSYTSALISRSTYIEAEKEDKLPNIDDQGNPLEVAEYVDDIYQYYWIVEAQCASLENYMTIQTDITPQMRSILINWLIEVHFKFDLMPETLYLAVALLDRYLSLVPIAKRQLQLVGLTSLLLASKYEDFWHPRVKDLISISAESYTRKEILEMEKDILKKLKFRLNLPTAYVFMLRFLKASQSEKKLEHLAFYLIELCLIDYEALKFRPSLLCASAVYVARCTLNKSPAWTLLLEKHAHHNELQIRECAEKILTIHKAASSSLLEVTHNKYKRPELGGVTAFKPVACLP